MNNPVIAIDGPSASGKSTVARELAKALHGFVYVDTGAMYRAVTWKLLQSSVDRSQPKNIEAFLEGCPLVCEISGKATALRFGIESVSPESLRLPEVAANVASVASVPSVRARLVALQRSLLDLSPLVMEGRDIGTVVFAGTPHKFYLDANPEVRASRRNLQGEKDAIAKRDDQDKTRAVSPLAVASDATVIDSSSLGVADVVALILKHLAGQGLNVPPAS